MTGLVVKPTGPEVGNTFDLRAFEGSYIQPIAGAFGYLISHQQVRR